MNNSLILMGLIEHIVSVVTAHTQRKVSKESEAEAGKEIWLFLAAIMQV